MTRVQQIAALAELAGMMRDLRLADVSAAARAQQASLDRLADLSQPRSADLDAVAEAQTQLRYQIWADQRRAEILPQLNRQTQALAQARDHARAALGRAEVLNRLAARK